MPGSGERADRQGQHELQRVPAAQRRARVRNPGEPVPQAGAGGTVIADDSGQAVTGDIGQGR